MLMFHATARLHEITSVAFTSHTSTVNVSFGDTVIIPGFTQNAGEEVSLFAGVIKRRLDDNIRKSNQTRIFFKRTPGEY